MQWSSDQACKWIRENCDESCIPFYRVLHESDLEQARFAYKDTSKIAKDVGSEVHAAIEAYLKREIARNSDGEGHFDLTDPVYSKLSRQAMHAFNAFNSWYKENKVQPLFLELTVWGERFAGTCDFLGLYKGKLYVIDWKTSKKFYPEMRYQVAAYRSTLRGDMEGCGVLMLDKETGMPTFKDTSKTYERDLKIFNAMVELYFLRHPKIAKRFEKGEK